MKEMNLTYTPSLDFASKRAIWILLLVLFEIVVGLTVVTLKPLYILILVVSATCIICSIARPYFAYVLLLLTLPFFAYDITGTPEVRGQIDVKFSDVAIILAIFCWLVNDLAKKDLSFEKTPLLLPLFLLYAWMFTSLLWCQDLKIGSADFIRKLVSLGAFFLTINLVTDRKRLDTTFIIWPILGLIYAFCGLWEVFHQGFAGAEVRSPERWGEAVRTSGYSPGPNRFGFFLNLCLMIAIPQLVTTKSLRYKMFLIFSIIMMILVLITTMSRGAWASFIASAIVLSFYSRGCRKALITGLIVAVVLLVAISTTSFLDAAYQRFAGLLNPTITKDYIGKPAVWSAAVKMFQDSPIVGVGIGSFRQLSPAYGSTILILPHNLYVYILAEFGLIGVAVFLFLMAVFLSEAIKTLKGLTNQNEKILFVGLLAGLLAYLVQGVSISFGFKETEMWAFFGLIVAAINIFGKQKLAERTNAASSS